MLDYTPQEFLCQNTTKRQKIVEKVIDLLYFVYYNAFMEIYFIKNSLFLDKKFFYTEEKMYYF